MNWIPLVTIFAHPFVTCILENYTLTLICYSNLNYLLAFLCGHVFNLSFSPYTCVLSLCSLLERVRIHSAERYSGLPDEGVIINAIGVASIAILAVVMYILSRDKFRTAASREHIRASVDL